MLYFAYGSNMQLAQMQKRCPSAAFVGAAVLEDYRLAFTRKSSVQWPGYGVADVIPEIGSHVWGALFEIAEREVPVLDKSEGYQPGRAKNAYERVKILVHTSDSSVSA